MHSLTIPKAEAELLLSSSWLPDHAIFTAADLDLDVRVNCRTNKGDTAAFRVCGGWAELHHKLDVQPGDWVQLTGDLGSGRLRICNPAAASTKAKVS